MQQSKQAMSTVTKMRNNTTNIAGPPEATRKPAQKRRRKGNPIPKPGSPGHHKFETTAKFREILLEQINKIEEPRNFPPLKSFHVKAKERATQLEKEAFKWVLMELTSKLYPDSIVPIIPSTNSLRMSHQSPQALRVFFSARVISLPRTGTAEQLDYKKVSKLEMIENTEKNFGEKPMEIDYNYDYNDYDDETIEKRYSYGLLSIINTTGFHPTRDMKVHPFSPRLERIVGLLEEELRKHLSKDCKYRDKLNFNSLEVKIYHGKDMFWDETGKPLSDDAGNPIRDDCNNQVNLHNDLCFDDNGFQSLDDTARGDHPIVTLTIGSERRLTFVQKWKKGRKWENGEKQGFDLGQGSIFCLMPDDEIPQTIGDKLFKTQHGARFSGEGVSIALVFRSVKTHSLFDKRSHKWQWRLDRKYEEAVSMHLENKWKRHESESSERSSKDRTEVKAMRKKAEEFLKTLNRKRCPPQTLKENNGV